MKIDVVLVNPPWLKEEQYKGGFKNVGAVLPAIGLLYLAAVLEQNNYSVMQN